VQTPYNLATNFDGISDINRGGQLLYTIERDAPLSTRKRKRENIGRSKAAMRGRTGQGEPFDAFRRGYAGQAVTWRYEPTNSARRNSAKSEPPLNIRATSPAVSEAGRRRSTREFSRANTNISVAVQKRRHTTVAGGPGAMTALSSSISATNRSVSDLSGCGARAAERVLDDRENAETKSAWMVVRQDVVARTGIAGLDARYMGHGWWHANMG